MLLTYSKHTAPSVGTAAVAAVLLQKRYVASDLKAREEQQRQQAQQEMQQMEADAALQAEEAAAEVGAAPAAACLMLRSSIGMCFCR